MMQESLPPTQTSQTARSLIQVVEQQLVDVRYAPLATKMVHCHERSDVPESVRSTRGAKGAFS
jgi:hypothetical protein